MSQPFIKLFTTPRNFYCYDVNTDAILLLSENIYKYLNGDVKKSQLSEEELKELNRFEKMGYLSLKHVHQIEHPHTRDIETQLNTKARQLLLQVTQSCNLTCYYCPYANLTDSILQRNHSNKFMSWDVAKKAIDLFLEHSIESDEISISFYGGEPFIAFDLIKKAVEYSQNLFIGRNLRYNITTNGTLLNDSIISFIVKNKIYVMFSIDGPAFVHDENRKRADGTGSFADAFNNLQKLAKAYGEESLEYLSINMVINPENEIDDIISLFSEPFFTKYPIHINSSIAEDDSLEKKLVPCDDFYEKLSYLYYLGYLKHFNLVQDIDVPPFISNYCIMMDKIYSDYKTNASGLPDTAAPGGPCIPGQRRLFVDVDGAYFPCERVSELSEVMKIGSIQSGFDYQKAKVLLNVGAISEDECINCWAFRHCKICARSADGGIGLSKEIKMSHCNKIRSLVAEELMMCMLIKEIRSTYKKEL